MAFYSTTCVRNTFIDDEYFLKCSYYVSAALRNLRVYQFTLQRNARVIVRYIEWQDRSANDV